MSVINLDSGKLNTISYDIKTLDENIIKEMTNISDILGSINSNVKGDINKPLTDMVTKYGNVQTSLKTNFIKLETFLDEQLKSYVLTEEQLEEELYNIVIRIRDFEVKQNLEINMKEPSDLENLFNMIEKIGIGNQIQTEQVNTSSVKDYEF